MWVLVAVVVLPLLLYIPAVQDAIFGYVAKQLKEESRLAITYDRLRLVWPLTLEASNVDVVSLPADTMAHAGRLDISVEMLPLLAMRVCTHASASDLRYTMVNSDSTLTFRATVGSFRLNPSTFRVTASAIDLSEAEVDDAVVRLTINPTDSVVEPDTTSTSLPLKIVAERLLLRRVDFQMTMMPTIDSLGVVVDNAEITGGAVNLENMIVTAEKFELTGGSAIYANRGHSPEAGFDPEYIAVGDVTIAVDSFYNQRSTVVVPLTEFKANERSGLHLEASGLFEMDSTAMHATDFRLATYFSELKVDGSLGVGDMATDPTLPVSLKAAGKIGLKDISTTLPSIASAVDLLPRYRDIEVEADIDGSIGDLTVGKLSLELRDYLSLAATGRVTGLPSVDNIGGNLALEGTINESPLLQSSLIDRLLGKDVRLPAMRLNGEVAMNRGTIDGQLTAVTGAGVLALDALWNGRVPTYNVDLKTDRFPVDAVMPGLGIGRVTATASLNGSGLDFMSPQTGVTADIAVESIEINNRTLNDINGRCVVYSGNLIASLQSANADADLDLKVTGYVDSAVWHTAVDGDIHYLNLQSLGMSETPLCGSMGVAGEMAFNTAAQYYRGHVDVARLDWTVGDMTFATSKIGLDLDATDSLIRAGMTNGDFVGSFVTPTGVNSLLTRIDTVATLYSRGLVARRMEIDSIQRVLPPFALLVDGGANSLVGNILKQSDITYNRLNINLVNDSTLHGLAWSTGVTVSTQRLDSVGLTLTQAVDTINFFGGIYNRPGTFDRFAKVTVDGALMPNSMTLLMNQQDIDNKTGYQLGFNLMAVDSVLHLHLCPEQPIINYTTWTLNDDNYVVYDAKSNLINADLQLSSGESFLRLISHGIATDSTATDESLQISAAKIHLSDWIAASPFAPPIKGDFSADIKLLYSPNEKTLSGSGTAELADFTFGKKRIGTFGLDLDLSTNTDNVIHAAMAMSIDSTRVMTARGALNDTTANTPMLLNVAVTEFPLSLINPFLPRSTVTLSGKLCGDMLASGTVTRPRLDGYIHFDSASVTSAMIGTRFDFTHDPIVVDSSIVRFDGFAIVGANDNPLDVSGTVDINSLTNPAINLAMKARNMQIVKSERRRSQDVYGKAFADINATVRGDMRMLNVNADLSLLAGSNLTYILSYGTTDLPSLMGSSDAVTFVRFSDSTVVADVDSIVDTDMALMLNAKVNINDGTTVNVELTSNAQDRVQLVGNGALTFTMSPLTDMRLTGRYTLNSGYVRYSPPLMSQKSFDFVSGSYVAFNGDILNPTLSLSAVDRIRANVTESGQNSRLVNFDVTVDVGQTLENMAVTFDLSTDDDITVKNELQSMSADQRANQAMNLLLYNVYTGPGTKGSANISGNPLYSFLASTLNTWAANNIKGVELTFGVDQYDKTYNGSTSTATSYNYQISKSFANDRLKVVVGGNYTDDATATQNYKESLINDISFEYMLNTSGTMYVKLFRHTGYESILEGEITQTGLGFVYRRNLSTLYSLLPRFMRPRRWRHPASSAGQQSTTSKQSTDETTDTTDHK